MAGFGYYPNSDNIIQILFSYDPLDIERFG